MLCPVVCSGLQFAEQWPAMCSTVACNVQYSGLQCGVHYCVMPCSAAAGSAMQYMLYRAVPCSFWPARRRLWRRDCPADRCTAPPADGMQHCHCSTALHSALHCTVHCTAQCTAHCTVECCSAVLTPVQSAVDRRAVRWRAGGGSGVKMWPVMGVTEDQRTADRDWQGGKLE